MYVLALCTLSALAFVTAQNELDEISTSITSNSKNMQDVQFITNAIQLTINDKLLGMFNGSENSKVLEEVKGYELVFDSESEMECEMEEGMIKKMTLLEVMNLIQARIVAYFDH